MRKKPKSGENEEEKMFLDLYSLVPNSVFKEVKSTKSYLQQQLYSECEIKDFQPD